jgi:hypothetical protein
MVWEIAFVVVMVLWGISLIPPAAALRPAGPYLAFTAVLLLAAKFIVPGLRG